MGDKFHRHSFKVTFKLKVKSVRGHILIFDIVENRIAGFFHCGIDKLEKIRSHSKRSDALSHLSQQRGVTG